MQKLIMVAALLSCTLSTWATAKPSHWHQEESCVAQYAMSKDFLQFFYKLDGNLAELNPNKVKRIEYLENISSDYRMPRESQKAAFKELYEDSDYWHHKLQRQAKKLIIMAESNFERFSWERFKEMAGLQSSGKVSGPSFLVQKSGTGAMQRMLNLLQETIKTFEILDEAEHHFERLSQSARLDKALPDSAYARGMHRALWKQYPSRLLDCQIEYLGALFSEKR